MGELVLKVEAAIAEAVLGADADPEFFAKLGIFLADHPGLIGRAAIEAMQEPKKPEPSHKKSGWQT
jgi:hypothetical protein